jgi:hypothetical protein
MPGAGAVHHIKTGKAQNEQMFSGLPPKADSDLRVNGYTVRHLFIDRYSLGKNRLNGFEKSVNEIM